jgi:hypothetical protein
MNTHLLSALVFILSIGLAIAQSDAERYNSPFVPGGGDKVLLDKEFVVGPEKVFMTFVAPKDVWESLEDVNVQDPSAFRLTYQQARDRAISFQGDNPPDDKRSRPKPISTQVISIERINVVEGSSDLNAPRGKYYYYVHISQVYPSPSDGLPEEAVNTHVIVLPNGWAAYPMLQFMRIKE